MNSFVESIHKRPQGQTSTGAGGPSKSIDLPGSRCRPGLFAGQLAICGILIAAAGCGRSPGGIALAPVTGIVRYNGTPVKGAYVQFSKAGAPIVAAGHTDESGKFTLTSYQKDDGAPVGENKVRITQFPPINEDVEATEAKRVEAMKIADPSEQAKALDKIAGDRKAKIIKQRQASRKLNKLPAKYESEETSKLTFDVKGAGKNECEFNLTDD